MAIIGVGTHLIECPRVARLLERHADAFLNLVFTPREQLYCRDCAARVGHLAAIWAGKEAVYRSLGSPWRRGFAWTDVELVGETGLLAEAILLGRALDLASAKGVARVVVGLTQTRNYASATAVAEE